MGVLHHSAGSPVTLAARARRSEARTTAISAEFARNWPFVGLRAIAAGVFLAVLLLLPPATIASLFLLIAAYIATDGVLAILTGTMNARRGQRSWPMVLEGTVNLAAAGAVLVWPAVAIVPPFVGGASVWAIGTGALLLAAARRLSRPNGRRLLVLAGAASAGWGVLADTVGPSLASDPRAIERWLEVYALAFGGTLFFLALRLRRRHLAPPTVSFA